MSAIPLLRRRRKRHSLERQQKQNQLTNSFIAAGYGLLLLISMLVMGGGLFFAIITQGLPDIEQLPVMLNPNNGTLLQPTRIYDRTGTHLITTLSPQDSIRTYISIDQSSPNPIPDTLVRSTLTLMDPGFWTHAGYLLNDITNSNLHSTLAQKLAFDVLLWNEPDGLRRALRERVLAAQLTSRFGREKILEWYLNSANYGHYAYGAEAAAKLYLGKSVSQLNLSEAALLASINQTPGINPQDAPQAALQRQAETINLMQSQGIISSSEAGLARNYSIQFQPNRQPSNAAPAFNALVLSQLEHLYNRNRIELGGFLVVTTLDYELQQRTSCALQTQFDRLENSSTTPTIQPCQGAETLPPLPSAQKAPRTASAVVLDPQSGQVLALVGDTTPGQNSTYITPHRPGTLSIPFIYLTSFTRGLSPASLLWDLPQTSPVPDLTFSISNQDIPDQNTHGPMRLRIALNNDSLVTAGQVYEQMGATLVQQTMASFGLDIAATNLKTLLETENRFSVIQIAQAYGILATQGTLNGQKFKDGRLPSTILSIHGLDGQVYATEKDPSSEQIISPQLATLLTDILSANFPDLGRSVAFKTGLTLDKKETWAIGYTPHRSVVVWMDGEALSTLPTAGLWTAIMQSANRGVPADNWTIPPGILRLKVCDPSGMLPTSACPNIVDEIFIENFQPTEADTLFKSYSINRETGLLATVFTPEQLIEKHVFMLVPSEARAWAQSVNLPVPPTQYDNIQPPSPSPDANLIFPMMFTELKGILTITGSAAGDNFNYYRLQYGLGLDPGNWTQIGTDSSTPITDGQLGEWDTTGLKGLYSLQLIVVHKDNSLQTATVQITLANP